jgi:FkbM family methyltransferase
MPDADGVCKTLERLLEPGKSFFDVGANIGQTAIVGSRRVGRRGRVAAFEPSAPNIQMLSYHVRWNRLRNVRVESTCVGASDGEAEFSLLNNGFDTSNSLTFFRRSNLVELQQRSHKTTVRVTTIDKYCQRTNLVPDLIKIDVEGAEFDVLVGMREVLTTKRPVLVMGLHPFWWPDGQAQFAIRDILTQCDYQVKSLQGEEATPDVYADFVCSPRRV